MKDIKQRIQHQIQCLNDQVLSHSRLLEFIDFLIENNQTQVDKIVNFLKRQFE